MYDNTYPPHTHMSQPQPYDMDPSMDQSMDMGPAFHGSSGPDAAAKDEFDPFAPPPKYVLTLRFFFPCHCCLAFYTCLSLRSTGDLRMWRQDHRGNLWTKVCLFVLSPSL